MTRLTLTYRLPSRIPKLLVAQLTLLAAVLAAWEWLVRINILDPKLVPAVSEIAETLLQILSDKDIFTHIGLTLWGVLLSCLIGVPVGVLIGVALERSSYWGKVLKPLFLFPLSIPKSIFLPVFILAIGISFWERVAFGAFSVVFLVILCTTAAVQTVRQEYLLVARSFGASTPQTIYHVYLPAMLPILLEGMRLAVIFGFTGIILAEMYAAKGGLGYLMSSWGENFMVKQLFAGVVLISAIAVALNEGIRAMERHYGTWRNK